MLKVIIALSALFLVAGCASKTVVVAKPGVSNPHHGHGHCHKHVCHKHGHGRGHH